MKIQRLLLAAGGYYIAAYVIDVLLRPAIVAKQARKAADARGKPLLNVGAGTPDKSIRARIFGPTLWGDINCDIDAKESCQTLLKQLESTPQFVCHCDINDLKFPEKKFGAVIASHVLEHVEDPELALAQLDRVADELFIITPKWWAPHTWLHPNHIWYRRENGDFVRLRDGRNETAIGG